MSNMLCDSNQPNPACLGEIEALCRHRHIPGHSEISPRTCTSNEHTNRNSDDDKVTTMSMCMTELTECCHAAVQCFLKNNVLYKHHEFSYTASKKLNYITTYTQSFYGPF